MFIPLLVILLGTAAVSAAPTENEELRGSGGDDTFEGDMILSEQQKKLAEQYVISTDAQQAEADKEEKQEEDALTTGGPKTGKTFAAYMGKWPGNKLYYDLSELGWTRFFLKSKIRNALKDLQEKIGNCVQFIEKESGPRVEVHTHNNNGCRSTIGYDGFTGTNWNKLNLAKGCHKKAIIQHEFLHALGFFHTQSRSDRDKYITVMEDNIKPSKLIQFRKYNSDLVNHFGLPYDYSSIMHYSSTDFSRDGWAFTLKTKDETKQGLIAPNTDARKLTQGDILMIKKAYGCA